jgi:hypothetical protein
MKKKKPNFKKSFISWVLLKEKTTMEKPFSKTTSLKEKKYPKSKPSNSSEN